MKDWRGTLVRGSASVRDTIQRIDAASQQIALVINDAGHLIGTVTDGDVRRALLRGTALDASVAEIMNAQPVRAQAHEERESILNLMQSRGIHQIPIVDSRGMLVGLEVLGDLIKPQSRDNWVVIMAGGLGARLRPLTDQCPKPMLRIGNRPILEHILETFVSHGYRRFYFAVNYLADMIERHFGDGSQWNAQIEYLYERQRLGTAGALSLLPRKPESPLLVMNGDLLTKVNFGHLLDFHDAHAAAATMCVRNYEYQIPYGVVALDGHQLQAIEEKPKRQCFVSAGMYVLGPQVLDMIPVQQYLDMPSLFERVIASGLATAAFPVREYWLDIGRHEDFEQANGDFYREFK